MYAAWKKKNEINEIVCFYYTQSNILLCGIARFSRGNKNKLRTFQPEKWKKLRTASLKQSSLVLIKKEGIPRRRKRRKKEKEKGPFNYTN